MHHTRTSFIPHPLVSRQFSRYCLTYQTLPCHLRPFNMFRSLWYILHSATISHLPSIASPQGQLSVSTCSSRLQVLSLSHADMNTSPSPLSVSRTSPGVLRLVSVLALVSPSFSLCLLLVFCTPIGHSRISARLDFLLYLLVLSQLRSHIIPAYRYPVVSPINYGWQSLPSHIPYVITLFQFPHV